MRRFFAAVLTLIMVICMPHTAFAAYSGPSDSYDPTPMTGSGAWSYVKVTPVSGETARTHFVFSNYQKPDGEGRVDKVKGLKYNRKKNILTINGYKQEDVVLELHNMGTGFTVVLKGKANRLRSIKAENDNTWDSGLKLSGTGQIVIGNETDHNHVPLDVSGRCVLACGRVRLIAEKADVGSGLGLRHTLIVKDSSSKKPLSTKMKHNKDASINTFPLAAGGAIMSSKDTLVFTK